MGDGVPHIRTGGYQNLQHPPPQGRLGRGQGILCTCCPFWTWAPGPGRDSKLPDRLGEGRMDGSGGEAWAGLDSAFRRSGGVRLGPPGWSGAWDGLIPGKGFHEAFSPASP